MKDRVNIIPANGKLGVLTPGMGAVATTFVAGVYAVLQGTWKTDWFPYPDGDH